MTKISNLKSILELTPNLDTAIGTDKNSTHSYIENFYEQAFASYQDKHISLLEIGVNSGGSLYMWGSYFKNGYILGLDIKDNVKSEWKKLKNTKYLIQDAYNIDLLNSLPNFDIIIDDGPHTLPSQIFCIEHYLKKINSGGMLIIEDIQNIDHAHMLKAHVPLQYQSSIEIIDLRPHKQRYDDILYVIKK